MIDDILSEAGDRMDKALAVAREDLATVRTGRANAAMFNRITVDYYGTPTPIAQLAGFQVPEARLIVITPYDRSSLGAIERAIRDSDLGVNPTSDGTVIRVALPQLTEERRREYVKVVRAKSEEARVSVRNIRRQAKDRLDKEPEVGEDDVRRAEKALDELTAERITAIDESLRHKEAELLEV
ncbi:MAG: ribosome recycling factor [Actinomycetales bacterium]|nr:ribosome recycling factor [Actinomycetales bacterium]